MASHHDDPDRPTPRRDTAAGTGGAGAGREGRSGALKSALIPLALGLVLVGALVVVGPEDLLPSQVVPGEELHLERMHLDENGFTFHAINSGSVPLTITQVLVDDAYWDHTVTPDRELDPLETATINVPYPWVEGEAHEVVVLTHTGTDFGIEVPIAVESPSLDGEFFLRFALIGTLVGLVPVGLGMATLPGLRKLSAKGERFILAVTLGLLAFLAFDGIEDALEVAEEVAGAYNPLGLLFVSIAAAVLIVWGIEQTAAARRETGQASGLTLAWLVALGIGLHNLGEGLVIGAAWSAGNVAFSSALILGFTLHNITEGPAIVSPALRERISKGTFLGLLALGGLPTILGAWLGGANASPLWTLVFFGLGVGAIGVVVAQVMAQLRRREAGAIGRPEFVWGLLAGVFVMYATGLLTA